MKTNERETRIFTDIKPQLITRSTENGEESAEMIIEGYATVFGERTLIGSEDWGFYEIIDRDAFNDSDMKDVPLKYNHTDAVPILARTRNGSLSLTVDDKGLKIRAKLLDTQDAMDMYKRIQEGLIDKMSFAFTCDKVEWDDSTKPVPTRTIKHFDRIWDVSVVDIPAYDGTSVYARSLEVAGEHLEELESRKHKRQYGVAGLLLRYKD